MFFDTCCSTLIESKGNVKIHVIENYEHVTSTPYVITS